MADRHAVSVRSVLIGAVGVAAAVVIVSYAELVLKDIQIAICQFAPAALGLLTGVVLMNLLARRFLGRRALAPQELMTIYIMILIGSLITSRGLMEKLLPPLVSTDYFATPENRWADVFFPHIPQWMVPFDVHGGPAQPVARYFYEGLRPGAPIPWKLWVGPLLAWSVLVIAVFFAFVCMASILRKQWVDNEKLTFPLVELPLEMTVEGVAGPFFRNPVTWIGFGVPMLIFTLNGLHELMPSVPQIRLSYYLNQHFVGKPWSDISGTTIYCSFAAIGFAYFLPAQMLFSLWFFFLMTRVQDIFLSMVGWHVQGMPLYPTRLNMGYQVAGAYMVLTAGILHAAVPHLRDVWRKAFHGAPDVDDSEELLPHRVAVIGLLAAGGAAIWWWGIAGMSASVALIEMSVYLFVVALVMARSVSEGGMMMTETSFRPIDLIRLVTPRNRLGARNLTLLSFTDAIFTRDLRGLLLTPLLDGLKITDRVRLRRRHLLAPVAVAVVLALVLGAVVQLQLPYRHAASTLYPYPYTANNLWSFRDYQPAIEGHETLDYQRAGWFVLGIAVTTFLTAMRTRYWWWPFLPLGYALSASWSLIVFWFPILVAWIIKTTILRYAGVKFYMRARPFFLGMILGEFSMAIIWTIYCSITRNPAPFFPWP